MQKIILIILLFGVSFPLKAQKATQSTIPISISYYGYNIFNPGIKVGTQFDFKKWNKTQEGKKGTIVKHKTRFVSPQIGAYFHRKNHTGILLNTDFGVRISKNNRKFYKASSFGVGYVRQFNAGTTYIQNENQSISEKQGAAHGYLMLAYNFEFGQKLSPSFAWFSKFSFASKFKYNTGISADLFFEIGGKFNLSL